MAVAAYVEGHTGAAPTVKQHLAAIRMCFDWLVTAHVLEANPAHAVKGPAHVVARGKTPVLSAQEARQLLEAIPDAHRARPLPRRPSRSRAHRAHGAQSAEAIAPPSAKQECHSVTGYRCAVRAEFCPDRDTILRTLSARSFELQRKCRILTPKSFGIAPAARRLRRSAPAANCQNV
jgi:hypothetical protein